MIGQDLFVGIHDEYERLIFVMVAKWMATEGICGRHVLNCYSDICRHIATRTRTCRTPLTPHSNANMTSVVEVNPTVKDAESKAPSVGKLVGYAAAGAIVGCAITIGVAYPTLKNKFEGESLPKNYCHKAKPTIGFDNAECVEVALEQAGGNVTEGYVGGFSTTATPITTTLAEAGLCPVNVHWHLGAEHLSVGEFDTAGTGPDYDHSGHAHRRLLAGDELAEEPALRCRHYDASDAIYTTEYDWKHCEDMKVGETYEVHWPHSNMGACNTPFQYQTPFYDGVFCNMNGSTNEDGDVELTSTAAQVGVQSQVFTIVNSDADEYQYDNLIRGMIVKGTMGQDIQAYTGSTTGTSRSNDICSPYAPITWHVDRKCHKISAKSFDRMCKQMKAQLDDMSSDLHPHGSRVVVSHQYTADNGQDINVYNDVQ